MSTTWLPCGTYHQSYVKDHGWWQTSFVYGKMTLLVIVLFIIIPVFCGDYLLSIAYKIGYTILAALGVQLLIGYCGQITLGHAAFVAVGSYTSAMLILYVPWPNFLFSAGLVYPISMIAAGFAAGLWSVLFGLPSARVKGFYLIMTTMAAQWITVPLVITQYVSRIGGRGHYFSLPPGTISIGPWAIDSDRKIYYLMIVLVCLCLLAMANLLRSRVGRAWIAIRDNDIAAETLGVNIVWYKLVAFFVAGFIAGIAGSFWISALYFVSPEHFEFFYSLWWVGVILIGGVGSLHGVVFGAMFMVLVEEILRNGLVAMGGWMPELMLVGKFDYFRDSAFGLAIILFLIYEPNGISYRYWQIKNYFNLWPFSY
ncbi:MAG: branched-chain amino acid ABC transporter permease [Desulfobacterales bacterium]|nr:MAG: branched-chain amino acid ABC transporter permease [Desulfobacterales bacterium]